MMLSIKTVNFIPKQVRFENYFQKAQKLVKKYSKIGICVLAVAIVVEGAGIAWYGSMSVPVELDAEYEKATVGMADIKSELAVIQKSKGENQLPMAALTGLVAVKPDSLKFTRIQIGLKGDAKNPDWILFEANAKDAMLFREYAARLLENPLFAQVSVNKIASTNRDASKSATIVVRKGKG